MLTAFPAKKKPKEPLPDKFFIRNESAARPSWYLLHCLYRVSKRYAAFGGMHAGTIFQFKNLFVFIRRRERCKSALEGRREKQKRKLDAESVNIAKKKRKVTNCGTEETLLMGRVLNKSLPFRRALSNEPLHYRFGRLAAVPVAWYVKGTRTPREKRAQNG